MSLTWFKKKSNIIHYRPSEKRAKKMIELFITRVVRILYISMGLGLVLKMIRKWPSIEDEKKNNSIPSM